jgi:hypothetical protein
MSAHTGQPAGTSFQEHHGATADGFSRQHNGNGEFLNLRFASVPCLTSPRSLSLLRKRISHCESHTSTSRERDARQYSNRERRKTLAGGSLGAIAQSPASSQIRSRRELSMQGVWHNSTTPSSTQPTQGCRASTARSQCQRRRRGS